MSASTYSVRFVIGNEVVVLNTRTTSAARAIANAKKTFYKRSEFGTLSLDNLTGIEVYRGAVKLRTPSSKAVAAVHG